MNNNLHKELYKELRQLTKEHESYVDRSKYIRYCLKDIDFYNRHGIVLNLKRELRDTRFSIRCLVPKIKKLKNNIKLCQKYFNKSKSK